MRRSHILIAASFGASYLYRVRAVDAGSNASPDSLKDLATTVIFSDSLTVGGTSVRAIHFTELRTAVNSVHTLAGLGLASFTDPTLTAGVTTIRAVHLTELRAALDIARSALTLGAATYTEAPIAINSTTIKALHISDLRSGVQ